MYRVEQQRMECTQGVGSPCPQGWVVVKVEQGWYVKTTWIFYKTNTWVDLNLSFEPSPDYPGIATAAGGAWGATVKAPGELDPALKEATNVVRNGRCAVVEVA